mmetsp:Transcript_11667/g.12819  ORF Transcript_11667/g.12819 Transcript_11667/m.12819 type:complete len:151 (-) Transcript_11667:121-573(-)
MLQIAKTSGLNELTTLYLRSFYTSPIFSLERFILRTTVPTNVCNNLETSEILTTDFEPNDQVAIFKVLRRNEKEAILGYSIGKGRSWLSISTNEESGSLECRFGSALGDFTPGFIATNLHCLYSKFLLVSAVRNLKHVTPLVGEDNSSGL